MKQRTNLAELDDRRFAVAAKGDAIERVEAAQVFMRQADFERAQRLLAPMFDDFGPDPERSDIEHRLSLSTLDEDYNPFDLEHDDEAWMPYFNLRGRISQFMAECVVNTQSEAYGSSEYQIRLTYRYLLRNAAQHFLSATGTENEDTGQFEMHSMLYESAHGSLGSALECVRSYSEYPDEYGDEPLPTLNPISRLIATPPEELVTLEQTHDYRLTRAWVDYLVESQTLDVAAGYDRSTPSEEIYRELLFRAMVMLENILTEGNQAGLGVAPGLKRPVLEALGQNVTLLEKAMAEHNPYKPFELDMIASAKQHLSD